MRRLWAALSFLFLSCSGQAMPNFEPNDKGFLFLNEPSEQFSPNSRDVRFITTAANNKNIMVYAHGGGGMGPGDRTRAQLFEKFGFDVLYFDAFAMNGVNGLWANRNLSDQAKQQMVINVLVGAIQFANRKGYENIVLYGQSNGARAILLVLNLLDETDKQKIKLILSEAPASFGNAYPAEIDIPTYFFVGDRDNWGGTHETDLMWERWNPMTQSTSKRWYEEQVKLGKPVQLTVYPGAGHGFHHGAFRGIERDMRAKGKITGYAGANPDVVRQYEKDLKDIIRKILN
jgi:dienelactone hydrolase